MKKMMLVQMMWAGGSTGIARNGEGGEAARVRERSGALFPTYDDDPFPMLL